MKFKKGDILQHKDGYKHKVLEVVGELYVLSRKEAFNKALTIFTESELADYTLVESEWMPGDGDNYWFFDERGSVWETIYSSSYYPDAGRAKFGNCFKTREQAERAAAAVKKLLTSKEF